MKILLLVVLLIPIFIFECWIVKQTFDDYKVQVNKRKKKNRENVSYI